MLNRRDALFSVVATGLSTATAWPTTAAQVSAERQRLALETLDMVHTNPGENAPETRYLDPTFLARRGDGHRARHRRCAAAGGV
jgi:hypothetical protein